MTLQFASKFSRVWPAAVVAAVCAGVPLAQPSQAASASWSAESVLAKQIGGAGRVMTAVNPVGVSLVVWDKYLGTDATHPYGIFQTYAAGRTAAGVWSAPLAISPVDAGAAGVSVDPVSGALRVFYTAGGVSYAVQSNNFGVSWSAAEAVPTSAGFAILTGGGTVGPFVDVDGAGNTTVITVKLRSGTLAAYDVEAMVKAANGTWSSPVLLTGAGAATLFGSTRLSVIGDGQALLNVGFTTFRRAANGGWATPQTPPLAGLGQVFSASAALDAAGKGYFFVRTHYFGGQLYTQLPGGTWSKPKRANKFEFLGSSVALEGGSAGHVMAYGIDWSTNAVRAAVSDDGGATWGPLTSFGVGQSPQAAGSENGFFALGWNGAGPNWDRMFVASGTGIAGATTAWVKANLAGGFASGPVAIAGTSGQASAQMVAGWLRSGNGAQGQMIGAKTGTISP